MKGKTIQQKVMSLIGGKEVLAYSVVIFGSSMVCSLTGSALSFFYTEVLHISAAAVGTIFLIARIWDAVNDSLMGVMVDKTRTKWGKCIPYLRIIPLPLFIISVFLFLPIQNLSPVVKTVYACIFYILYDAMFTAIDIPINGLQPLLFTGQNERNKAVSISSTLGSMGTILPSGLYFALVVLIGGSEQSPMGNFIVASVIIGIGCLCMFFASFRLKEKVVIPPKKKESIFKTIKPLFKNKPLLILLVVSLFAAPMSMSGNVLVYFCKWNFADTQLGTAVLFPLLQISSGAAWILSILSVPFLLKKMSKKKLFIITGVVGAILNVILFFIGYENMWVYLAVKFLAHFPGGIIATLTTLLLSDSIEYAEWKTGERTEGVTFSIVKLIAKISTAVISSLTMFMLAVVNYDSEAMQATYDAGVSISQTYPDVLNMIFVLMTLTVSVAFVLQIIPMFFYKFDGEEQEKALAELRARRKEEHTEVTQ